MSDLATRPIEALWQTFPTMEEQKTENENLIGAGFADIFKSAIENVRATDDEKNKAEYLLATGQLDNPAELTIAATKAATAVSLLVQLRNKALDAYNELMRINI
ncbi:MAG: flagellar hook-basal body complex protein FliE [Firmicutes bacterium]|nr:flagellar hook-basal body complex protein FliE [Bacillota bacterium]